MRESEGIKGICLGSKYARPKTKIQERVNSKDFVLWIFKRREDTGIQVSDIYVYTFSSNFIFEPWQGGHRATCNIDLWPVCDSYPLWVISLKHSGMQVYPALLHTPSVRIKPQTFWSSF